MNTNVEDYTETFGADYYTFWYAIACCVARRERRLTSKSDLGSKA